MRTAAMLAAGSFVAALVAAPLATAGKPPLVIVGARYSIKATGAATLSSTAELEVVSEAGIHVRATAPGSAFVADVLTWSLKLNRATTTLVLGFRIGTTSDSSACPAGARGTVTAVDDDRRLANGRSKDSVRVRFGSGKCGRFVRAWTNAGGERRARVEIRLEVEP